MNGDSQYCADIQEIQHPWTHSRKTQDRERQPTTNKTQTNQSGDQREWKFPHSKKDAKNGKVKKLIWKEKRKCLFAHGQFDEKWAEGGGDGVNEENRDRVDEEVPIGVDEPQDARCETRVVGRRGNTGGVD